MRIAFFHFFNVPKLTPLSPLPAYGGSTLLTILSKSKDGIFDFGREGKKV